MVKSPLDLAQVSIAKSRDLAMHIPAHTSVGPWKDAEKSFQELFVRTLQYGKLAQVYEWSPVLIVHREFRIHHAICDVVSFHEDGSITVFELKRAGMQLRDYATGIGQLMHASVQFSLALAARGEQDRELRLVLAVPSGVDPDVGFACQEAGIEYMPFGTIEEHNAVEVVYGSSF